MDDRLTYVSIGMTREGGPPAPPGFHVLRVSLPVGRGPDAFEPAGRALLTWRMHRAAGLRVDTTAEWARPGAEATVRLGPLRAPCRVVWTVQEADRTGFAYGTLPGHPECGEEAFTVEFAPGGGVRLTVHAVSRPAAWYTRAAGPLGRLAQRGMAHRYAYGLRRALAVPGA